VGASENINVSMNTFQLKSIKNKLKLLGYPKLKDTLRSNKLNIGKDAVKNPVGK
jgi:hypothetical protein